MVPSYAIQVRNYKPLIMHCAVLRNYECLKLAQRIPDGCLSTGKLIKIVWIVYRYVIVLMPHCDKIAKLVKDISPMRNARLSFLRALNLLPPSKMIFCDG